MFIVKRNCKISAKIIIALFLFRSSSSMAEEGKINTIDSLKASLATTPNDTIRVQILNNLSWYYRLNDYPAAVKYAQESIELAKTLNFFSGEAQAANYLGVIYRNWGRYPDAINILFHARDIAEKHNLKRELGFAYNNLGDMQRLQGEFTDALKSINMAEQIFFELKDTSAVTYVLLRKGEVYQAQEHYSDALLFFQKALQLRLAMKDTTLAAACYIRIGQIYRAQQQYQLAIATIKKAISLGQLANEGDIRDSYTTLARIYLDMHHYKKAIVFAEQGLHRAQKVQALQAIVQAYSILYLAYEGLGDSYKALSYYKLYYESGKELELQEAKRREMQLTTRHDFEKKQQEIEMLRSNYKIRSLQLSILSNITVFLVVFIVIAIAAIIVRRKVIARLTEQQKLLEAEKASVQQRVEEAVETIQRQEFEARAKDIQVAGLQHEIRMAADLQEGMLPKFLPKISGYEVAASLKMARDAGGDLYDVIPINDAEYLFVVGDVSGKGMPAALYMSAAINVLRTEIACFADVSSTEISNALSPAKLLKIANAMMKHTMRPGNFISLFLGILNIHTHQLRYSSGGHDPCTVWNPHTKSWRLLNTEGQACGAVGTKIYNRFVEEKSTQIEIGDYLIWNTDGITEAKNTIGEEYSDKRLEENVKKLRGIEPTEETIRHIIHDIEIFVGDAEQYDDMTLLCLRRIE